MIEIIPPDRPGSGLGHSDAPSWRGIVAGLVGLAATATVCGLAWLAVSAVLSITLGQILLWSVFFSCGYVAGVGMRA